MKGFVFDLDNTLYDRYGTIEAFMRAYEKQMMPYVNPAYDIEKAIAHVLHTEPLFIHNGWEAIYPEFVHENFFNSDNTPTYSQFQLFAKRGFTEFAVKFDGIPEFLQELKDRGYAVALLTNANDVKYQYNKLDMLGLRDCFDKIIISGEYAKLKYGDEKNRKYEKPNPEIFYYTADLLGIKPSELYYVGDNAQNDVMGALNSGFVPIWVRSRSPWVIDNKYMPKICVNHVLDILKTDGIF